MTPVEHEAYKLFCKENTTRQVYKTEELDYLEDALDNYILHKASPELASYLEEHPLEPLQVVRDRKIVDYLYAVKGLTLKRSVRLWSDWEDFEFELREAGVNG